MANVHETTNGPTTLDSWWNAIQSSTIYQAIEPVLVKIGLILLYYILARISIRIGVKLLHKFMNSSAVKVNDRRRATMESLLDNILRYTVYFLFIVTALSQIGIHLEALLAGAGIAGLAVGFGAQNLIKDVLTGFFILFEDQYGVGDVVKINGFTGTVKSIGLRLTRLQAWTGEVEIIPNGQVQQVTNFSRENSLAVIDISVSHDNDIRQVIEVTKHALVGIEADSSDIIGEAKVLGVQSVREFDVLIRATIECLPNTQAAVTRNAHQRIKEAFHSAGVEMTSSSLLKFIKPVQSQTSS